MLKIKLFITVRQIKEKLDIEIKYFFRKTSSVITLLLNENILANNLKQQFGKHDKIKTK